MNELQILISNLANVLGLQIMPDGKVYDADTFTYLVYNGGYLYCSLYNRAVIHHKKDTEFDPIRNAKLVKYLFNMLLNKEAEDNSLYVNSYGSSPQLQTNPTKYRLEVSTSNGHFESGYYFLESLQYIEMMFIITGTPIPINIHDLDLTKEQIFEKRNMKG